MTDEAYKRLAGEVRVRRRQLGLTQAQLAEAAGLSEPTIRVIETARRGSYEPATLRALAEALGWTKAHVDEILGEGVLTEPAEGNSLPERVRRLEGQVAELMERLEARGPGNGSASRSA